MKRRVHQTVKGFDCVLQLDQGPLALGMSPSLSPSKMTTSSPISHHQVGNPPKKGKS